MVPPPSGLVFCPDDNKLITQFLGPRIAAGTGRRFGSFIHEADAYSAAPADLVRGRDHAPGTHTGKSGGHWYFFSPTRRHQAQNGGGRRQRAVVGEAGYTWHSEVGEQAVLEGGRRVGYKRQLSYVFRKSPGATRTRLGWCMTEFGLDDDAAGLVLCKVYRSPRAPTSSAASKKRKADDDASHPQAPPPHTCSAASKKRKADDDASRRQAPHRQEMDLQERARLQAIERFLLDDEDETMPAGATNDDVVVLHPAFDHILEAAGQSIEDDDGRFQECTFEDLFGE
ncbi:unnamed protein product [Alopecurus aequalis]